MTAVVLRGDARSLPLPDASVDLICTSPPYFALRDYRSDGRSLAGQVGAEPTPGAYLDALLACTREWMRVLKPAGSIFVNLGDKYGRGSRISSTAQSNVRTGSVPAVASLTGNSKSLIGLPWRYALGCTDQLGLVLRAEIVWSKPNGLPESVQDRVRRSHEQVFHFTKESRYYSAIDEIREDYAPGTARRYAAGYNERSIDGKCLGIGVKLGGDTYEQNSLGKMPGSVWEIPSQPLTVPPHLGVDHFAAFPFELPRRVILGWSPPGICTECGEGRRPVTVAGDAEIKSWTLAQRAGRSWHGDGPDPKRTLGGSAAERNRTITGYACACTPYTDYPVREYHFGDWTPAPVTSAIVLDPFGGTGTTALVADVLGRTGISFDLSADYCRLARWRTTDRAERARAMQVPKPPPVADDQGALFDLTGEAAR
jgi:DNA modification methylase